MVSALCAVLVLAFAGASRVDAHKPITSKYNYNEHVYPIVRDRCGRCHYEGGPTPMSLLTYKDAVPWAESMREQLTGETMPPWPVDPLGPAVKGGHTLLTNELDVLLTWASGGTPEGDSAKRPSDPPPPVDWKLGAPDRILTTPSQTLAAGTTEDERELTILSGLTEERWVKAVDLLPGTRSMVRSAVIALENGPVLCAWEPGADVAVSPSGTAFRIPAGAALRARIRYKKNWQDEQKARADESRVGLYFTDPPVSGRGIETLPADGAVSTAVRVIALRPHIARPIDALTVDAILPSGTRVPLLALHGPRPGWDRRYWLAEPIELPRATRLEVSDTVPVSLDVIPF